MLPRMMRSRLGLLMSLFLGAVGAVGCGGTDPIVGTWSGAITPQMGDTDTLTLTFATGGALTVTVSGTGSCSGTVTQTGVKWMTAASTLSFDTSNMACSGAGVMCADGALTCSSTLLSSGSCTFSISNNQLVLSACGNGGDTLNATYTRSM
jgi:hypothetical protein